MIDYEKLKVAHELAEKLPDEYSVGHYWANCKSSYLDYFRLHNEYTADFEDFESIDDLIDKLQELTQPKPKYRFKPGDSAFFANGKQEIIEKKIKAGGIELLWSTDGCTLVREACYPSREALMDAQIEYWEYWSSLKNEEKSTCSEDVSKERKKAPFKDYKGNDIYEGDKLIHPVTRESFIVEFDSEKLNSWRAIYENGDSLALGIQVSERGQAAKECDHEGSSSLPAFEGEIKGFNDAEDSLEKVCMHGRITGIIKGQLQYKCDNCGAFY